MDFQLAIRVLWRFKILVAAGLVFAVALAFLSMVRVQLSGQPTLAYRTQPQYESLTSVLVTTHGFPWGSLKALAGSKNPSSPRGQVDGGRLRELTSLYIQLAASDDVRRMTAQTGPMDGTIQAFPVFSPDSSVLPFITLSATGPTPRQAQALGVRYLKAFRLFIEQQQNVAGIANDDRVVLQAVSGPDQAHLLKGRKLTKPILIFMAVLVGIVALAFLLENLRPRVRVVAASERDVSDGPLSRRTA